MALPGTLTIADADVEQGYALQFDYTVSADHDSAKNWIGIYSDPGDGPVDGTYHGASTLWQYTPGTSGSATFSSGALSPGAYRAFYLYDDGYASLADSVAFQVTPYKIGPEPPYRGELGGRYLRDPGGIAADGRGRIWVADRGHGDLRVLDSRGRYVGSVGARALSAPQDVAVHDGSVYAVDSTKQTVEVFDLKGRHTASIGKGDLQLPRGVAVTPSGDVLVADVGGNRVVRYTAGKLAGTIGPVHIPQGIAAVGDDVWVVSSSRQYDGNNGVTLFRDGTATITLGYGQNSKFGGLSNPAFVAVDAAGHVIVTVSDYGWAAAFDPSGPLICEFATSGKGLMKFPQGVLVTPSGEVVVADSGNHRLVRFGGVA